MLKTFGKICVFCCVIWIITSINVTAQIVGGGSMEKPVSAQLGGLVNANIFNRLGSPSKSRPKATPAKGTVSKTVKGSKTPAKTPRKTSPNKTTPIITETETDYSVLNFNPVNNAGIDQELAAAITNVPTEKSALLEVFKLTKNAYETEAAKKGKRNDIAMATTFFIATCLTAYHDVPEPSETAIDNLYNKLADAMAEENSIINSSNIDKQLIHDRLVYLSGLILVGYTSGKQNNDAATTKAFRLLAGVCLKSLMQLDPDKLSFNSTGLVVKS